MVTRALLLDDDILIAKLLQGPLSSEGLQVSHCKTLESAYHLLNNGHFELLLVDRMLEFEDGLELVRYARVHYPAIGIIVLSGKAQPTDRIVGLESGADDYLSKPLDPREVVIRARRLAARARIMMQLTNSNILKFQNFSLDPLARVLSHPSFGPVPLTGKEFDVLHCLARSGSQPLSRKALLRTIHDRDPCTTDRTIDTLISNIRRKLRVVAGIDPVCTIRGGGYAFGAMVTYQQRSEEMTGGA
jgi:two-component system OmpR family response regulator